MSQTKSEPMETSERRGQTLVITSETTESATVAVDCDGTFFKANAVSVSSKTAQASGVRFNSGRAWIQSSTASSGILTQGFSSSPINVGSPVLKPVLIVFRVSWMRPCGFCESWLFDFPLETLTRQIGEFSNLRPHTL